MWVVFNYPLRSRKVLRVQPHDSSPVSKGLSALKNQAFYRRINVLWEKKRFIFALWLNLWLSEASFFCHWTTARVKIVKVKNRYTIVSQGKYLSWWFETVFPFLRCCGIKQECSLTHFKLQKKEYDRQSFRGFAVASKLLWPLGKQQMASNRMIELEAIPGIHQSSNLANWLALIGNVNIALLQIAVCWAGFLSQSN